MGSRTRRSISARTAPASMSRINGLIRSLTPASFRGPPTIPMNPGASFLLSRIRAEAIVIVGVTLSSGTAFAIEPCHRGVPTITLEQGSFAKAPGTMDPDAEKLHPDGKLQEQWWHNLHAAIRPLKVICHYANKDVSELCRRRSTRVSGSMTSGECTASDGSRGERASAALPHRRRNGALNAPCLKRDRRPRRAPKGRPRWPEGEPHPNPAPKGREGCTKARPSRHSGIFGSALKFAVLVRAVAANDGASC